MSALLRERVIVSVGGTLLVPGQIDIEFLQKFRAFIETKVAEGYTFCIIVGGGSTARHYQEAASAVTPLSSTDLDWIGIHTTRLNAHLIRTLFAGDAYAHIIKNPAIDIDVSKPIIVAAGWQPGCSTDYDAVLIAKNLGLHRLINLSDVDHVYNKDPKKHADAKKLERVSWGEFRSIMPDHWDPGLATPFDPVAAKEAASIGLEVVIINGAHLDRFAEYLDQKPFIGTVIS